MTVIRAKFRATKEMAEQVSENAAAEPLAAGPTPVEQASIEPASVEQTSVEQAPVEQARIEPSDANHGEALRILEAMLFASAEPVDEQTMKKRLPDGVDIKALLEQLAETYAQRGVNLTKVAGKWAMRTASDLGALLVREAAEPKKLSRAAIETLAIVAYHQPVTRAEIEEIRGVTISKGTLDLLIETGWVRLRGRRRTPGRPVTYGTSQAFLEHFGLEAIDDLPGLEELKGAGFLEGRLPSGFSIPVPNDDTALREDEEDLETEALDLSLAPQPEDDAADEPVPATSEGGPENS